MQRLWIGVVLCVIWAHGTQGAEPLPPPAQRALKVAQDVFTPAWAPCGGSVTTQVLPQGGRDAGGFHQMQPVVWTIEEVYPLASDGQGRQEQTYQVSAYTTRYRSWGGTWTPWNTGMPWEQGNIEIFNARVTLPAKGTPTHAAQYFIFTEGALRKPLCKNIPAG
jgi:hypothetical protein